MNPVHRRAKGIVILIGSLMIAATAQAQSAKNNGKTKQPQIGARGQSESDRGVERAANIQPPTSEGWQPGQEPSRGGAQRPPTNQPATQGAPVQPPASASQRQRMPFTLTPQEEANLDQILIAWERQSSTIKTYKCEFTRWEYGKLFDGTKLAGGVHLTKAAGELKYSAPDKGMFKVTSIELYNAKSKSYEQGGPENLEHWVCDGRSIFQIDHKEKTRTEQPLPPEMQGQAISDGPLPFVFGAKAAKLKERYWMREIASPDPAGSIWLQAYPRYQADATNFRYVEVIMGRQDFMPRAIQMFGAAYNPREGNEDRVVFSFENVSFNGRFDNVFRDFIGPDVPFGYKKIVRQPAVERPAAGGAQTPRENARSARAAGGGATR